jgi:hypothetical protein
LSITVKGNAEGSAGGGRSVVRLAAIIYDFEQNLDTWSVQVTSLEEAVNKSADFLVSCDLNYSVLDLVVVTRDPERERSPRSGIYSFWANLP